MTPLDEIKQQTETLNQTSEMLGSVLSRQCEAIEGLTQSLEVDQCSRREELDQRKALQTREAKLAQLKIDASIAIENTPRQSPFLARLCVKAEASHGLEVSPDDFLCGILNAIQESGIDLSSCTSRKDIQEAVQYHLHTPSL